MPNRLLAVLGVLLLLAVGLAATQLGSIGVGTASARPSSAGGGTAALALHPTGQTTTARLVRVSDGDTIVVDVDGREERVRYIGMDTPEIAHPGSTAEPFGDRASAENTRLLKTGTLILEREVSERDRFGRLLRHVWVRTADGADTFVGLELVREGLAEALVIPPEVKDADLMRAAEREAQRQHLGIWGD